jgi:hypothetical protein
MWTLDVDRLSGNRFSQRRASGVGGLPRRMLLGGGCGARMAAACPGGSVRCCRRLVVQLLVPDRRLLARSWIACPATGTRVCR